MKTITYPLTFIGDVHGHFDEYNKMVREIPGTTIQVGDKGLGFGKDDLFDPPENAFLSGETMTTRKFATVTRTI